MVSEEEVPAVSEVALNNLQADEAKDRKKKRHKKKKKAKDPAATTSATERNGCNPARTQEAQQRLEDSKETGKTKKRKKKKNKPGADEKQVAESIAKENGTSEGEEEMKEGNVWCEFDKRISGNTAVSCDISDLTIEIETEYIQGGTGKNAGTPSGHLSPH